MHPNIELHHKLYHGKSEGLFLSMDIQDHSNALKEFSGVKVVSKTGRIDYIFSNTNTYEKATYNGISSQSTYSVVGTEANGNCVFFMGNGVSLSTSMVKIKSKQPGMVVVSNKNGKWFYSATTKCEIIIQGEKYHLSPSELCVIK